MVISEAHVHLVSAPFCLRWQPRGVPWRLIGVDMAGCDSSALRLTSIEVTYALLHDMDLRITDWASMRPVEDCTLCYEVSLDEEEIDADTRGASGT